MKLYYVHSYYRKDSNFIAPASVHILCIALRYNKPNKPENHMSILFNTFFDKTRASILFLRFQCFE